MASKSNSPIGVYFNPAVKEQVEKAALELGKRPGIYIRDLVQSAIGLPEGSLNAAKLKILELEKENQRLKYEGQFNSTAFQQKDIEVVDPIEVPNKLRKVQLV